jgi:hypothetical protein
MKVTALALVVAGLLVAPAVGPDRAPPAGADPGPVSQPGPVIDVGDFAYTRPLAAGPAGLVSVSLDAAVLAHSAFARTGSFADLRIVDQAGRQVPYLVEHLDEPMRVPLTLLPPDQPGSPGRSVYLVMLPHAGLPAGRLVLRTNAAVFRREVEVEVMRRVDRAGREPSVERVLPTVWRHDNVDGSAAPALSLQLPPPPSDRLQLIVSEGDNVPLPITGVELQLPMYRVRFHRPAQTALSMLYGRPGLAAPEYDLALLRREVLGSAATEITAGAERQQAPGPGRTVLPPTAFWMILVGAVVALVWLIAMLVRMVGQDT